MNTEKTSSPLSDALAAAAEKAKPRVIPDNFSALGKRLKTTKLGSIMNKIAMSAFVDELEQIKLAKLEGKMLELASKMKAQKIGPYGAKITKALPSAPLTGGITPGAFGRAHIPRNLPAPPASIAGG